MFKFIKKLFSKQKIKKEKIRFTIRDDRLVKVYYPSHIVGDRLRHPAIRQQVACYEIKLNGFPGLRGLGTYYGFGHDMGLY